MLCASSAGFLVTTTALAQTDAAAEDPFGPSTPVEETAPAADAPAPETPVEPAPAPAAAAAAAPAAAPAPAPAPAPTPAPAAEVPETAAPAPASPEAKSDTDHAGVVGHLGVGYLGWQTVMLGRDLETRSAPVIGVRYWLTEGLGLDVGIGFGYGGATTVDETPDNVNGTIERTTTTAPGQFTFLLHGGVPLSLAAGRHFSFQVVPELNVGFAATGDQDNLDVDNEREVTSAGYHIGVGARVGGEIQFGFMGLPELALQASVGAALRVDSGSTTTKVLIGDQSTTTDSQTVFGIGTTVDGNPWDIFASNISALYYF